ncbi:hypothetical protein ILYODFUR_012047 [Ilyodon furcidens]|uniref:Secreted protein n=1 Tax=Ilyodon furcidens TaxID=33524 RepID=A0ABV0SM93_9TELE
MGVTETQTGAALQIKLEIFSLNVFLYATAAHLHTYIVPHPAPQQPDWQNKHESMHAKNELKKTLSARIFTRTQKHTQRAGSNNKLLVTNRPLCVRLCVCVCVCA